MKHLSALYNFIAKNILMNYEWV